MDKKKEVEEFQKAVSEINGLYFKLEVLKTKLKIELEQYVFYDATFVLRFLCKGSEDRARKLMIEISTTEFEIQCKESKLEE